MAIPATQMRPGMIIKHNNDLHLVFTVEHRTPGNLRAFIQAKLRNLRTGAMFEHRFRSPDPIEAIKFRMEQQGLTRRDLEEIIGTRTRIAEVLNRKRGLSVGMIRRLHERLGISAEVLIRPSRRSAA